MTHLHVSLRQTWLDRDTEALIHECNFKGAYMPMPIMHRKLELGGHSLETRFEMESMSVHLPHPGPCWGQLLLEICNLNDALKRNYKPSWFCNMMVAEGLVLLYCIASLFSHALAPAPHPQKCL